MKRNPIKMFIKVLFPYPFSLLYVFYFLQVIANCKQHFGNLKVQFKNYAENTNKCLGLHEQRDSVIQAFVEN